MHNLPWNQPGRFYKGNIHCHSNRSDGILPPAEALSVYRDAGYSFVALTDHFMEKFGYPVTDTREYRTDTFTTLLGAELHAPRTELGDDWHILAVGLPVDFAPTSPNENASELAARAAEAGAFIGIPHPAWYGLTIADALSIPVAHAIEIYGVDLSDRAESWYLSDALSARGHRLTSYAADDYHFAGFAGIPEGRGRHSWIQVRSARLDPGALLAALKAGHYYSSQGPEVYELAIVGNELHLTCSRAQAIYLTGRTSRCDYRLGDFLTRVTFPLEKFRGSYCRVTIVDDRGKRAWTNPIWLDGPS